MSILAPLLRPAAWRLSPGAADVPWLHHLGLSLLLASVAALLAWSGAIWFDAWRHRSVDWVSVLALPLCVVGLIHAWRIGVRWLRPGADLTLRWTGPVSALRSGEPAGGWRVDEWGAQPVEVRLVWDWQHVMLLRVRPWEAAAEQAWVWLQDRRSQPEREVHRLRTLLCLPPAMTRPQDAAGHSAAPPSRRSLLQRLMASSRHASPADTRRMSRDRQPARPQRPARRAVEPGSLAPLRIEDDFPATQILDRWQDEAVAPRGATGGRP